LTCDENFNPFWIILNPVPEVLPQSEPVQQEEEEGVMEVWEARRDDRDFCQQSIKVVDCNWKFLILLGCPLCKASRPTPIERHPFPFGDVKQTYLLFLASTGGKRAWCAFLSSAQPKGARLNTFPWHFGSMDWGLTASLGSFVLCLSLEFIWPVPWGIWRWTWKLWRQWRWMVGTCTNIIWTLPVPAWHACDKSISSSQRDENTVENQIVKLRSVVQLCNLEAVGFQWMVAKIVYQVVESVPSLWELTHALKTAHFW